MDAFQIEKVMMSVLKTLHAGMATVKADCATKSRSDYRREMTVMGTQHDFNILTLCLAGCMKLLKTVDGKDFDTAFHDDITVVYYANVVRIVVKYDTELEHITLVFTDRRDEADKAERVATTAIERIMSMGA